MAGAQFQDADIHEVEAKLKAAIEEYLASNHSEAENAAL